MAIFDIYCIYWTVWDRYMQVPFLGRAPRTKETLPDFLKWRRVTRPPLVFRRLTGSQRTPGFWGVTSTALKSGPNGKFTQWAFHEVQEHLTRSSNEGDMTFRSWRSCVVNFDEHCSWTTPVHDHCLTTPLGRPP